MSSIHCGDFADRGNLEHVRDFRDWFQSQTQFTDKVVIAGNHDRDLSNPQSINLEAEFSSQQQNHSNNNNIGNSNSSSSIKTTHFLQDESITCANGRLCIFGCSWETCAGDRYENLQLVSQQQQQQQQRVDVLLSHMPPYWPSDHSSHKRGSLSLAKTSFVNRIPITCGGHLHWARGATKWVPVVDDTTTSSSTSRDDKPAACWFINASSKQPVHHSSENNNPRQEKDNGAVYPPVLIWYDVQKRQVVRMEGLRICKRRIPSFFTS